MSPGREGGCTRGVRGGTRGACGVSETQRNTQTPGPDTKQNTLTYTRCVVFLQAAGCPTLEHSSGSSEIWLGSTDVTSVILETRLHFERL